MLTGREIGRRKQPKIYVGVARVTALILPFPIEKDAVFFFRPFSFSSSSMPGPVQNEKLDSWNLPQL